MAKKLDCNRPRLKNLDDLFLLNQDKLPPADGFPSNITQGYQASVEMDKLVPFTDHPFHLYKGERLDDMIESIRSNGVLVPIIVRASDETHSEAFIKFDDYSQCWEMMAE